MAALMGVVMNKRAVFWLVSSVLCAGGAVALVLLDAPNLVMLGAGMSWGLLMALVDRQLA